MKEELREVDFYWKERRKENLQTDEILCPLRLYKFPELRETFGFPLLAQLNEHM